MDNLKAGHTHALRIFRKNQRNGSFKNNFPFKQLKLKNPMGVGVYVCVCVCVCVCACVRAGA